MSILTGGLALAEAESNSLCKRATSCSPLLCDAPRGPKGPYDHRSLGDSSGKGLNNMEMISNTADTQRFCVQVAADRSNVGVHARPNVAVQPRFTIISAEDNMNDDLAKRLRNCGIIAEKHAQVNRAVSASEFFLQGPGALPRLV